MQYCNTEHFSKATSLQEVLNHSFLKPWLLQNVVVPVASGQYQKLADYAILLDDRLILIIEKSVTFAAFSGIESLTLSKQKKLAQETKEHFIRDSVSLLKKSMSIRTDSCANQLIQLPDTVRIKVIMVSKINIAKGGTLSSIKHGYSKDFYSEKPNLHTHAPTESLQQVVIQYFSLGNLKKLINGLETVVDIMDFIDFHKRVIKESDLAFDNSYDLLKSYIASSAIFNRAKNIDYNFVESGLRSEPAPILRKQTTAQHINNYKLIKKNAQFWSKVLGSILPTYNDNAENMQMMLALSEESLYSRHLLTSCMLDFIQSSEELQQSGYMMHMRSYSNPNKHYAFLFYAQDESHQYHRSIASTNLTVIAEQINQHQQPDYLSDIIIIGLQKSVTGFDIDLKYLKGYLL